MIINNPLMFEFNVEHWLGDSVFTTLNYVCWAENSEHAIEQCIDHYNGYTKDITICKTYILPLKESIL